MTNLHPDSKNMAADTVNTSANENSHVEKMEYQTPMLMKYGEITRLTMKAGSASDAPLEGGFSA